MKALRLKLFQETACYTKPFSRKVTETYPLPPYSVIKGMIHALLHADRLIPMAISIQGNYESKVVDYRKTYMVKKGPAFPIIMDGLSTAPNYSNAQMTSMPLYSHMLFHVELLIHITAEESILQQIFYSLSASDSALSIGRYEDLAVLLDNPAFVEVKETDEVSIHQYSMYIPEKYVYNDLSLDGIPYQLNWTYEVINGIRQWRKIPSIYVTFPRFLNTETVLTEAFVDQDGHPVFWNI
ncbi:type I-B CRISPR-associated protein Cas5b [Sporolactobacillus sp. CPB3-1]|uniref:Type I-B CRISPR-associated protein Cas5b n=1 Tax=Sporolactobacillus mangiferae TaxID=2940498 RepID=A0ABT0MC92_9BACL|nr:type I-B CRISPR-associated protein Cas5b [Sporolactobacillus mangiferae]MCL1632491.1 type I-B CRISPR-associated protein Cas5b [Sporolactobacillus mangiferae]